MRPEQRRPLETNQAFQISPTVKVGEVLERYPQSLDVFVRHGFTPLRNPVLRKTMARVITIEQACRREGLDMSELLRELNKPWTKSRLERPAQRLRRLM